MKGKGIVAGPDRGLFLDPQGRSLTAPRLPGGAAQGAHYCNAFIDEDAKPFAWTKSKVYQR